MANNNIKADKYSLQGEKLFATGVGLHNIFIIPEFQRPYVWKKENWEALFNDIAYSEDLGYFIGSIICVEDQSAMKFNTQLVIDGQQRLTTISLFYAAIYKVLKSYEDIVNQKDPMTFRFIKNQLIVPVDNNGTERTRIVPQNQDNINDYLNIFIKHDKPLDIGLELIDKNKLYPLDYNLITNFKIDGRCSLPKAYAFFKDQIIKYSGNGDDEEKVAKILELYEKLNFAQLVMITTNSLSSAGVLFETLNHRGQALTITDIIKNKLYHALGDKKLNNFQKSLNGMIDKIILEGNSKRKKEISASDQVRFFRHSYDAFRNDWIKDVEAGKYDKKVILPIGESSHLYDYYCRMIELDCGRVFSQIEKCAKIYPRIQGKKSDGINSNKLIEAYKDLNQLDGRTSYTLLLYLVDKRSILKLEEKDFEDICKLLISFFVRRSFSGEPPANKLDEIFRNYIEEIKQNNYQGKIIFEKLSERLKEKYYFYDKDDIKFKMQLNGDVYNNAAIRLVLIKIAEHYLGKQKPAFGNINNGVPTWSIEHILPQTLEPKNKKNPDWTKSWVEMLTGGNGNLSEAEKIQEKNVHKLGNLTLTAFNPELSNRPFEDKRDNDVKEKDGMTTKYSSYKNSVVNVGDENLNTYICKQDKWTQEEIEARTELLIEVIVKNVFKW